MPSDSQDAPGLPAAAQHDVIIVGGGPGGSSAAAYLARTGARVLVLEKERFPRFHIGESLLPYNQEIFRELGVLPAIQAAGFPRKVGARFFLGDGTHSTRFVFGEGRFTREPEVVQVDRAKFDHILLRHARSCGAEVREGWTALRTSTDRNGVTVTVRDGDGQVHSISARFVIDASGRANLTGTQEGLRVDHPRLKKIALFGHFAGVALDEGEAAGDTVITRLENKWFWIIPVAAGKTSVGLVLDKEEFAGARASVGDVFHRWVEATPVMRERMKAARVVESIRSTTDFSYLNRRLVGRRLIRIGDAAGFIDPIFSAGVFLAMWSGKLAAEAIQQSLVRGDDGARRFRRYERRFRSGMNLYRRMVECYYTQPFMDLFLQPRHFLSLPDAVNAILAGELNGGFRLRWRIQYFFLLVWLQRRHPLVPRLSYEGARA